MITRKEADKRVKAWRGQVSQQVFEHPNGHKFMKTYLLHKQQSNKVLHLPPNAKEEWTDVVMDSFVHEIQ